MMESIGILVYDILAHTQNNTQISGLVDAFASCAIYCDSDYVEQMPTVEDSLIVGFVRKWFIQIKDDFELHIFACPDKTTRVYLSKMIFFALNRLWIILRN